MFISFIPSPFPSFIFSPISAPKDGSTLRYVQNLHTTYLGIKSYRTSVMYLEFLEQNVPYRILGFKNVPTTYQYLAKLTVPNQY